jgi:hypothetical protein
MAAVALGVPGSVQFVSLHTWALGFHRDFLAYGVWVMGSRLGHCDTTCYRMLYD